MSHSKKFGFAQAAKRLGLSLKPYASIKGSSPERRSVYRISDGQRELFTLGATILSTSFIGMKIAADKATTNEILRHHGIPTTEQLIVSSLPELEAFYNKHQGDVLMKPLGSTLGRGVHASIQTIEEARNAFKTIQKEFQYVVIEKKIRGKEYRILIFENQIIAAAEFIPPTLTGNGSDTILLLINQHNNSIIPGSNTVPIPIKPELVRILNEQGLAFSMIPEPGETINLYRAAPISHGGHAVDVTDRIHPINVELFLAATRAIHLNIAGIDVITEDINLPLIKTGGVIIEINGGPDLSLHQGSIKRPYFDPAEQILRQYFGLQT